MGVKDKFVDAIIDFNVMGTVGTHRDLYLMPLMACVDDIEAPKSTVLKGNPIRRLCLFLLSFSIASIKVHHSQWPLSLLSHHHHPKAPVPICFCEDLLFLKTGKSGDNSGLAAMSTLAVR